MAILFAGGEAESFTLTGTAGESIVTTTFRDSNYARVSMSIPPNAQNYTHSIRCDFAATDDCWLNFRIAFSTTFVTGDRNQVLLRAADLTPICRIVTVANPTLQLQRWNGSAWQNVGDTFDFAASVLFTYTLRYRRGVSGGFWLYQGGTLLRSYEGDTSSLPQATNAIWGALGPSITLYISEVIVADQPLLGARLKTLNLAAVGAHAEWTGAKGNVDHTGPNDSSAIVSDAAAEKNSYTHGQLFASETQDVLALVVSARARKNTTGPDDLKGLVRVGTTDYNGTMADLAADYSFTPNQAIFAVDPATSAPWTHAAVDAAEIGVESAVAA